MSFQKVTVDLPTAAQRETAPYKHSEAPEFFSSVVEEFVVWSKPQQLRLAVRAAIAAYAQSDHMLDAALACAAHGFSVFPSRQTRSQSLRATGMRTANLFPALELYKATTDPIQIRAWWNRKARLIGLPMGAATGVWGLDVDTGEDHADGVAKWEKIAAQHDPITTREHRSATDGPHLIFDWRAERLQRLQRRRAAGWHEVKGEGGYIVVPRHGTRATATPSSPTSIRPTTAMADRSDPAGAHPVQRALQRADHGRLRRSRRRHGAHS